jgi:RNaseH domain of pPIWI_RE/MID domain of pPIWI_RE
VYSGGTTLSVLEDEDADQDDGSPKAKTRLHPARSGFLPVDHLELHEQLLPLLESLGIVQLPELKRCRTRRAAQVRPCEVADQRYVVELWTQSDTTQQAVIDTLTRKLGFAKSAPGADSGVLELTGPSALTLIFREAGGMAAGIPRPSRDGTATPRGGTSKQEDRLAQRVDSIVASVPRCEERRAAIVELEGPRHFARTRMDDPKPAIKKGLPLTGRVVQCIRPIREYRPKPDAKRPKPFLTGTPFAMADANRAASAIQDALRQLGRVGTLAPPPGLAGSCELIGIWLERAGGAMVPILVRIDAAGAATAQILVDGQAREMPYADLPLALVEGRGRQRPRDGVDPKAVMSRFLIGALGIGDRTNNRVVFVRSASFRSKGWDWLQDGHITPDLLVVPGRDPRDDQVERLSPSRCPGLRIIRVRERDSASEVPRGFGVAADDFGRVSGLFRSSDRVFYGVNPRSDQAQTPKGLTKLDPDLTRNAAVQGSNPNPLEIVPIFLQDGDDPEEWAMYTHTLRQAYLHTDIASQLPLPLHLGSLADEYLV